MTHGVTSHGRKLFWALGLLGVVGLLMAGCEGGTAPQPTMTTSQVQRTARLMPTFTPLPKFTNTPASTATPVATDTPPPPTTTNTPAATDTPAPTATATPRPQPTRTRKPPTPTTSPFEFVPDGPTRHEANPSFTEIKGTVRAADGTPLDGVIVILNTGGMEIPLPTGQRPGYYSWVWCDWARDGTFELYVLGSDGQPASPRVVVQTFSKDLMAIATQDWKRTW